VLGCHGSCKGALASLARHPPRHPSPAADTRALDVFAGRVKGKVRANPFSSARIETPRLLLRPFEEGDWSAFEEIASQEAVLEFLPPGDRMTREELRSVFAWLLECYRTNTVDHIRKFTLPVVLKQGGEVVGWCGLGPLEFDDSELELYFVVGQAHWGKGFATEAARALLGYAFGVLGLRRVAAVADPRNHASIRVLEKLGMSEGEAVRGLAAHHRDYEGHARYSMSAEDWSVTAKTSN
jgi:[ribosomal protein S5]-alanine N-acetyltransferase